MGSGEVVLYEAPWEEYTLTITIPADFMRPYSCQGFRPSTKKSDCWGTAMTRNS